MISDKQQVFKVLKQLLGNVPVVVEGFEDQDIGFISVLETDREVEVKLRTGLRDTPEERVLLLDLKDKRFTVKCRYNNRNGMVENLTPRSVAVSKIIRRPRRLEADQSGLTLFSLTSLAELSSVFQAHQRKVQALQIAYEEALAKKYPHARVYLISDGSTEPRSVILEGAGKFIHVEGRDEEGFYGNRQAEPGFLDRELYWQNIRGRDLKLGPKLTSEICVPILFRGRLPVGFVQVNSTKPLGREPNLNMLKKTAMAFEKKLHQMGLPLEEPEPLEIKDINKGGLGLSVGDRKLLRHFGLDNRVLFTIKNGSQEIGWAEASVANRSIESGNAQIGLKFGVLDALTEVNLDEFLDNMKREAAG